MCLTNSQGMSFVTQTSSDKGFMCFCDSKKMAFCHALNTDVHMHFANMLKVKALRKEKRQQRLSDGKFWQLFGELRDLNLQIRIVPA
jgi:hypothetical protein